MCGIAGVVGACVWPPTLMEATMTSALQTLRHRGPDADRVLVLSSDGGSPQRVGEGAHTRNNTGDRAGQVSMATNHANHTNVINVTGGGDITMGLAATRLAIIAPHPRNNQPLHADDLSLVFNGEIYDYQSHRNMLRPHSSALLEQYDGDGGVLMAGWRRWMHDWWSQLHGMWAVMLIDHRRKLVVLSRDPMGEKPLYWTQTPPTSSKEGRGHLWVGTYARTVTDLLTSTRKVWGGEVSTPSVTLEPEAMLRYWGLGYRYAVHRCNGGVASFVKGIHAVPAGTALVWTFDAIARGSPPETVVYTRLSSRGAGIVSVAGRGSGMRGGNGVDGGVDHADVPVSTLSDALNEEPLSQAHPVVVRTRETLLNAVRHCTKADVALAVRLSGGVDSGIVAGAMRALGQPVNAYAMAIGDRRYDETDRITAQARHVGANLHWVPFPDASTIRRWMTTLAQVTEMPLMTVTTVLNAVVSSQVRADGLCVTLGGTGADEMFAGYYDHALFRLADVARGHPDRLEAEVKAWRAGLGSHVRNPLWLWSSEWQHRRDPYRRPVDPSWSFWRSLAATSQRSLWDDMIQRSSQGALTNVAIDTIEDAGTDDNLDFSAALSVRRLSEIRDETLPVLLHQDDLATMITAVETRAPFLQPDVVALAWALPHDLLIHRGVSKAILRWAAADWLAPAVVSNTEKVGFNADFERILPPNIATLKALLDTTPLANWFDPDLLCNMIHQGRPWPSGAWFALHAGADFLAHWTPAPASHPL